jgi:hypothetical protein
MHTIFAIRPFSRTAISFLRTLLFGLFGFFFFSLGLPIPISAPIFFSFSSLSPCPSPGPPFEIAPRGIKIEKKNLPREEKKKERTKKPQSPPYSLLPLSFEKFPIPSFCLPFFFTLLPWLRKVWRPDGDGKEKD